MEINNYYKDKPLVSVCCLAYNHEKYIKKTLDGFVNQKTSFSFEVLIHDDCSTDDTAKIISDYALKYPEIIKPIFQKENQTSKGINVQKTFNYPRIKGEYVAFCEGDDYWCDENKLQVQIDALIRHPDCTISTHITEKITKENESLNLFFPPYTIIKDIWDLNDYLISEIENRYWTFQLSSFIVKKEIIDLLCSNKVEFVNSFYRIGDFPLIVLALTKGNLVFINKKMSCYRCMSGGFMSAWLNNQDFAIKVNNGFINGYREIDIYTNYKYHDIFEKAINYYEFKQLILLEKFSELRNPKYIEYYNKMPIINKVAIFIGNHSKILYRVLLKFRNLVRNMFQ